MSKNVIEITSEFRDRYLYPSQYEFIANISENGLSNNSIIAKNPISLAYPSYNFQGPPDKSILGVDSSDNPIGLYINDFRGPGNPRVVNIGKSRNYDNFINRDGYYDGLTLIHVEDASSNQLNTTSSIIKNFYGSKFTRKVVNNKLTTSAPFYKLTRTDPDNKCILMTQLNDKLWNAPSGANTNTNVWFMNWGKLKYISQSNTIRIHGGSSASNFYNNYYLEDISLDTTIYNNLQDRFKKIISYDGLTKKALLSGSFSGWNASDKYRVRKAIPLVMGWGTSEPSPLGSSLNANSGTGPLIGQNGAVYEVDIINAGTGYSVNSTQLSVTNGSGTNLYLEITTIGNNAKNATGSIKNIRVAYPGQNYQIGEQCIVNGGNNDAVIRIKNIGQSIDISNGFNNTTGSLSTGYDTYKGHFIYIPSKGPEYLNQVEDSYPEYYRQLPVELCCDDIPYSQDTTGSCAILSYITCRNTSNIPGYSNNQQLGMIIISGYKTVTNINLNWEILPFSYDGVNDFKYFGSKTSIDQFSTYKLKMNGLILPNVSLKSSIGDKIAFYPHIYVEICNISSSNTCTNNIISNNPNTTKALFKIPVKDITNPERTKFIKFDCNMTQFVRFNINDNIKIKIYFDDGKILESRKKDNAPPLPPNNDLQTSLLFTIERI